MGLFRLPKPPETSTKKELNFERTRTKAESFVSVEFSVENSEENISESEEEKQEEQLSSVLKKSVSKKKKKILYNGKIKETDHEL